MKIKKIIIASLSFVLLGMYSITPISASTTINLGKFTIDNVESEIIMTETFNKIVFTAYLENDQEMSSYFDKNTKKVFVNNKEVNYSFHEGTAVKPELPYITTNTNIDSTPVNVTTGISINFTPIIEAGGGMALAIALAHFGVTSGSLLALLGQTTLKSHWKIIIDLIYGSIVSAMGGYGAKKLLNITFKYDLQRTKGLIYLNGGSVPVTGYRYANYRATIKVAGKTFSKSSGKYGAWWSSSKPYSLDPVLY